MSDDTDYGVDSIFTFSSNLEDAEPSLPIPVGEYLAEVVKGFTDVSKNTGKRYARITFRISPENYPVDYPVEEEPDGALVSYMLMADNKPNTQYRWRLFLEALDFFGSSENQGLRDLSVILERLPMHTARVEVVHEEYEGQTRAKVKTVSPA